MLRLAGMSVSPDRPNADQTQTAATQGAPTCLPAICSSHSAGQAPQHANKQWGVYPACVQRIKLGQPDRQARPSSLDCSDIAGASSRSWSHSLADLAARHRLPHASSPAAGSCDSPGLALLLKRQLPSQTTTRYSLVTADIPGAQPLQRARREVNSPGRGTLHAADIPGTAPGSRGVPWGLGRVPKPSMPSFRFSLQPRTTAVQLPHGYALAEPQCAEHRHLHYAPSNDTQAISTHNNT
ncbi:hypothetical protein V8C86DRAFT_2463692 [Haematococcus lacustris]